MTGNRRLGQGWTWRFRMRTEDHRFPLIKSDHLRTSVRFKWPDMWEVSEQSWKGCWVLLVPQFLVPPPIMDKDTRIPLANLLCPAVSCLFSWYLISGNLIPKRLQSPPPILLQPQRTSNYPSCSPHFPDLSSHTIIPSCQRNSWNSSPRPLPEIPQMLQHG